jgi:acyl-coenzyme A thioesterase PaaI-like protein
MTLADPIVNRDLLPHNTCFGCGHENATGLRIEVFEPGTEQVLNARFTPSGQMVGFPGIVHGGAIYTALDCLSTWVATLLGPNRGAAWVLRSANVTYHNPGRAGEPLQLTGWVTMQTGRWDPLFVQTEARRPDDALCVEAEFKVVPLRTDKLLAIVGIDDLPDNWRQFLQADG